MANIMRRSGREPREMAARVRPSYADPFRMMDELMRWNPFSDYEGMGLTQAGAFVPTVDVRETPDAYVFKADLPGVKEEDLDISLTGNRLTISGHRQDEKREEQDRYHCYECSYGSFSRSFGLPDGTDADNVKADMTGGVLTVTVPKRPEVQPRKINVSGGSKQPGGIGNGGGLKTSPPKS